MKTRFWKLVRFLSFLCWAILVVGSQCSAQAPVELSIRMEGEQVQVTVKGNVGTVYSIECVSDLAQADSWRCLEFLQLNASPCLWTDNSTAATEARFYRAVVAQPRNMVLIPAGTFMMGSPANEVDRSDWEGSQTVVTLTKWFWMGKYEVTQGEYLAVMGNNPSWFNGDRTAAGGQDYGIDLNRPVELVTWYMVHDFCTALTRQERGAGRIPTNYAYRLPTEAEWEYVGRTGTTTRFSYGDDLEYANLANYSWNEEHTWGQTHPVGQKLPNAWGLYDMYGNVWEHCEDWWSDSLPGGSVLDPRGPDTGEINVIRGGGFRSSAPFCRSAARFFGYGLDSPVSEIGIRVVLAADAP